MYGEINGIPANIPSFSLILWRFFHLLSGQKEDKGVAVFDFLSFSFEKWYN
jgi:hypothetical protein